MTIISPRIASLLADSAYDIKKQSGLGGYRLGDNADLLEKHFDFDLSNGPVKGVSGGFLSHLFNQTTGFALLGKGKGRFQGDHVIAIRGTASYEMLYGYSCGVNRLCNGG